ncbi:glyoxalase, partial [bacterium]|nr:glyoxalase [bacterium]
VAENNGQVINPVEKGHIAFRTDDIEAFKTLLEEKSITYSDYGTAFAKDWHQIFFKDPEGNIVEVHQKI